MWSQNIVRNQNNEDYLFLDNSSIINDIYKNAIMSIINDNHILDDNIVIQSKLELKNYRDSIRPYIKAI